MASERIDATKAGGAIVRPLVDDQMFRWVDGGGGVGGDMAITMSARPWRSRLMRRGDRSEP